MKETDEDVIVIKKVLAGDTNSFETLLRKYQDNVAGIVASKVPFQSIPEVTHDVFVRAYKSLAGYGRKEPFGHWLRTIAVRTCHDFWRVRYRNHETPISTLSEGTRNWLENYQANESAGFSRDNADRLEVRELLEWALDKLTPEDRMIILLVYFDGYSVRETAGFLDLSTANVKVRAFRARKKLRKILGSLFP